ncbi:hypothetical protein JW796_00980 [Candidatus Dojkabacteria bacterium]|nr:hypothetical protein [Candidatus Dojkabacteria bacterium]
MSIQPSSKIIERTIKNTNFDDIDSLSIIVSTQNLELQKYLVSELTRKIMGEERRKENPDILRLEISDRNSIGINDIKGLIARLKYKPYQSKRKVAIIEKAENMTLEAQNAFLKTLEDIPDRTFIILSTANHGMLLPTILSRCRLFEINSQEEKQINYDPAEILKMNLYERFELAEKISRIKEPGEKRSEVNNLLRSFIEFYRDDLKNRPENKKVLELLSYTMNAINENVNVRLVLENLMLNLNE